MKAPRISWLVYLNNSLFSFLYRATRKNFRIWYLIARHYHPALSTLAKFNACSICDWSSYHVPAYQDYLKQTGAKIHYWNFDPTEYPETDKESYIKQYDFAPRCKHGRIPLQYTTIDESSGSTGTPYNWVRTIDELTDVHTISSNYIRTEIQEPKLITINAFSMGAWATGLNMTLGLLPMSIVKSIGPDMDKIIDTLKTFKSTKEGGYAYLICGYPPFIKHLFERMRDEDFPFEDYRLYGMVGGESMTEAMRNYLEQYFIKVRSGYGATDIQLGVGGETSFTIWSRKQLLSNPLFREKLLGTNEHRTPMIFHYNPLDHYIETNEQNEIIITINNFKVLSPRVRYNVKDEGMTFEYQEFIQILKDSGYSELEIQKARQDNPLRMPLLVMYGRKDGTISYMGANIYPQDVEQGLYSSPQADKINNFKLELKESKDFDAKVILHLEVKPEYKVKAIKEHSSVIAKNICDYLASVNRDFAESLKEDSQAGQILLEFHTASTGPFANQNPRQIKNKYLIK